MKPFSFLPAGMLLLAFTGLTLCSASGNRGAESQVISLAGEWRFQLDAEGVGTKEKWFTKSLQDQAKLPGTTDENHKGIQQDERPTDRLMRPWYWKGAAWYQRDVVIPEEPGRTTGHA